MSDPFDEFEEFRARSYSGGLSLRPTDPGVHKSMVELCLSSDKTGLKAISKKCYGSAYFNGPSPTTESTSPTHYGHSLHPNVNCQVETTTRRASHHNIKSTSATYGISGCNNNYDNSDPGRWNLCLKMLSYCISDPYLTHSRCFEINQFKLI